MSHTTLIANDQKEVAPEGGVLPRFPRWSLAHWCVVTAAASFLILAILPEGQLKDLDAPSGAETVRVARSLASHGTFADPFVTLRTGPTAHVAPVYPFLYSLLLRGFGTGPTALRIAWALNVGFLAVQMGLLPLLSSGMKLGLLPGIVAAGLGTVSLYAPIDTRWEAFFVGLLLMFSYFVMVRSFDSPRVKSVMIAGVLWGALVLSNPVLVLLLFVWPLCWIARQPKPRRAKIARHFGLTASVALLVISPWIVRNYLRFDTFIFVRDNLGLELSVSNNPCAAPTIGENIQSGCHARTHPNISTAVAAQLAAGGEVAFNRAKLREALNWISSHPGAFSSLTLRRFRLFWFPNLDRWWEAALVWTVTLLSFAGLWLLATKNSLAAWLIGTAWLLFPLIYYITQFEPRYRYPIYWTSLLPAGYALTEISKRLLRFAGESRHEHPCVEREGRQHAYPIRNAHFRAIGST